MWRRRTLLAAGPLLLSGAARADKRAGDGSSLVVLATHWGPIRLRLFTRRAPRSCQDFLKYVQAGLYDPGRFFRTVRPGNDHGHPTISVLQGGIGVPARAWGPIGLETTGQTGIRHRDSVISLPRDTADSGSGAEFFICIGDQPSLDEGGHRNKDGLGFAAFGQVEGGMEIVRRIWAMPAHGQSSDSYTRGQILTTPVPFTAA